MSGEPRFGYGDAGHQFDPDRFGRCRKAAGGYCDGTRADSMHERREPVDKRPEWMRRDLAKDLTGRVIG